MSDSLPQSTFTVLDTLADGRTVIHCEVPWHKTAEGGWRATCTLHDGLVLGFAPPGAPRPSTASHRVIEAAEPGQHTWADGCPRVSPTDCHGNPGFCTRCSPRSHGEYGDAPRPEAHEAAAEPVAEPLTPYQRAVEVYGSEGVLRQSIDACRRCDMEPGLLWVARSCPEHGSLAEGMAPEDAVRIATPQPETELDRAKRAAAQPCPSCNSEGLKVLTTAPESEGAVLGLVCTGTLGCGRTHPLPDDTGEWPQDYLDALTRERERIQRDNLATFQRESDMALSILREQPITVDGKTITVPRRIAEDYRAGLITAENVAAAVAEFKVDPGHRFKGSLLTGRCVTCDLPARHHDPAAFRRDPGGDPARRPAAGILHLTPASAEPEKAYGAVPWALVWSLIAVVIALTSLTVSIRAAS
jgi:hypothetical protein